MTCRAELDVLGAPHVARTADAADREATFALVARGRRLRHRRRRRRQRGDVDRSGRSKTSPTTISTFRSRVGVKGTVWLMQAAFPVMREQGRGRIVTFGSNAALAGVAHLRARTRRPRRPSAAVTRTAAAEWGRFGITVNCVCPVSVRHHTPGLDDPEALAKFERELPAPAAPARRATRGGHRAVVGFLLSDASAFVTGQTLMADGGRIMFR